MRVDRHRASFRILLIVFLASISWAQVTNPVESSLIPSAPGPFGDKAANGLTRTFSARVREVNVLFSASDWRGHLIANLTASDLQVFDNGKPAESLTYFVRETELPLKVELLMDVSGSVHNVFHAQQEAAIVFLEQMLRGSDSASIAAFADRPKVVEDFTSDVEELSSAVRKLSPSDNATAVYDAVKSSCTRLSANRESTLSRRVLILITDGEDNLSQANLEDAIDAALQSDVVIFALNTNAVPDLTQRDLEKLTGSTGGKVLSASGTGHLKSAFRKIINQLRSQYLLGYKPPSWQPDGSFHKIRVTTHRFGVQVHCRKGYFAID